MQRYFTDAMNSATTFFRGERAPVAYDETRFESIPEVKEVATLIKNLKLKRDKLALQGADEIAQHIVSNANTKAEYLREFLQLMDAKIVPFNSQPPVLNAAELDEDHKQKIRKQALVDAYHLLEALQPIVQEALKNNSAVLNLSTNNNRWWADKFIKGATFLGFYGLLTAVGLASVPAGAVAIGGGCVANPKIDQVTDLNNLPADSLDLVTKLNAGIKVSLTAIKLELKNNQSNQARRVPG